MTFDRRISSTILKYIGVFESRFRSIYSRLVEEKLGQFAFYDKGNFLRLKEYKKTKEIYETEISRCLRNPALQNVYERCDERIPVGIAVEQLSLGCLSKMYSNTCNNEVTGECAAEFNLKKSKFSNWLKTLTVVRNRCAHFDPYIVKEQIPMTPQPLNDDLDESKHPFYVLVMLEHLLSQEGISNISDMNINYSARVRSDVRFDVSQFLALYGFSYDVARSLWIPERYIPNTVISSGREYHELCSINTEYVHPIDNGYGGYIFEAL